MDLASAPELQAGIAALYEQGMRNLMVDLRDVTFLGLAGLRLSPPLLSTPRSSVSQPRPRNDIRFSLRG